MSFGVVLVLSFLASLTTEAWSHGERATLSLTLQPTPLKGGCPSREVIAQIHEDVRTAIEETVKPARKMLHEQQAAVNPSESGYCWEESLGGNGQCCISGEQWEEVRPEITTRQWEQCNATLEETRKEITTLQQEQCNATLEEAREEITTLQQEQCNATLEEARPEITTQQQEECNATLAEARAEILDTIRGDAQYPATSCKQITELRPGLPSGYYWITTTSDNVVQVYCDVTRECCNGTGGWTRVAYLNMSDPTHSCPPGWRYIERPKRTCGRRTAGHIHGPGYETVTYSTHGIDYSRVCGQIRGYQEGTPDAFRSFIYNPSLTIDDSYVDGVSVTYGTSPRKHIWTFAAAIVDSYTKNDYESFVCPCTRPPETDSLAVPPFVGNDYFCEAGTDTISYGTFFPDDPLWDGQGCPSPNTCCQFNSPPWFCKTLPEPTTEGIEVRIMANGGIDYHEDIPIELIEIYIQ